MARKSTIEKNQNRERIVASNKGRRERLKAIIYDRNLDVEARWEAGMKLAQLPRNGAKIRLRNRCALTGRPRGYYRKLDMSRIALRELASQGLIPGMTKSSW